MKCINCKKEIINGQAYCINCGEKLSNNIYIDNKMYNDDVENKMAEYKSNIKEDIPVYGDKVKNILTKNKIATVIGLVVILALIIGICIFNFLKGMPVSEKELQTYLVGQDIVIEGNSYEIKSEDIKSLEITSRNSEKKVKDKIEGELTLDLDNAIVEADVMYELNYDKNNSKWYCSGVRNFDVKNTEPKVDLNDSIKDLLKSATIYYDYNSIKLNDGLLKDIKDISIDGEGSSKSGTAKMVLSNGVVEATVSAEFKANFDLEEGKWKLSTNSLQSKVIDKEKIAENISDDDKKKFVLNAFDSGKSFPYKYKAGSFDSTEYINLDKDNISDLKINNFMEYENAIRVEIQGQADSGEMSKIKFSGVANLKLSLNDSYNSKVEVNIESLELSNVNVDSIKKEMLKYKVDDKQVTVAMADTYNIGTEGQGSTMFSKIYEGIITVDGVAKKVRCRIDLNYDQKSKKYQWNLESIDVIK